MIARLKAPRAQIVLYAAALAALAPSEVGRQGDMEVIKDVFGVQCEEAKNCSQSLSGTVVMTMDLQPNEAKLIELIRSLPSEARAKSKISHRLRLHEPRPGAMTIRPRARLRGSVPSPIRSL